MKKYFQNGFTLIEMVITVGIIGVLATVAIEQYAYYVAKSQVAAAMAEASQNVLGIEGKLTDEGVPLSAVTVSDAEGLRQWGVATLQSSRCIYTMRAGYSPTEATFECALKGSPKIQDRYIQLVRHFNAPNRLDGWRCKSDIPDEYLPTACTHQ
jgi:type IV pilus assembly protein PilA